MTTTYSVAMRDATGKTIIEDVYGAGEEAMAKERYRCQAATYQAGGYGLAVAEVALFRVEDGRRRSTIRSTRSQTSRSRAAAGVGR